MLQCFEDYSPFIWTIVLSTLTLFDVFYFVRHIWVATEASLLAGFDLKNCEKWKTFMKLSHDSCLVVYLNNHEF